MQMIGDFRPCAGPVGFGRAFGPRPMARMQNRHELVADTAERGTVNKAQQLTQAAAQLIEQVCHSLSGIGTVN